MFGLLWPCQRGVTMLGTGLDVTVGVQCPPSLQGPGPPGKGAAWALAPLVIPPALLGECGARGEERAVPDQHHLDGISKNESLVML